MSKSFRINSPRRGNHALVVGGKHILPHLRTKHEPDNRTETQTLVPVTEAPDWFFFWGGFFGPTFGRQK